MAPSLRQTLHCGSHVRFLPPPPFFYGWLRTVRLQRPLLGRLAKSIMSVFCQSRITPLCFCLVFSLCFIPTVISHCVFFHSFFLVFPTHPRTLSPPSALPHPLPSLFIQGLVSVVLCICLKIGLGRETFSSENNKSVRLILWKALQSGRALFRLEDYYIVNSSLS